MRRTGWRRFRASASARHSSSRRRRRPRRTSPPAVSRRGSRYRAMLRGWGFSSGEVTLAVTLTGVWNQLIISASRSRARDADRRGRGASALRTMALIGSSAGRSRSPVSWSALERGARAKGRRLRGPSSRGQTPRSAKPVAGAASRSRGSGASDRPPTTALARADAFDTRRPSYGVRVLLVSLRVFDVAGVEVDFVEAFAAWSIVRVIGRSRSRRGSRHRRARSHAILVGFGGARQRSSPPSSSTAF